MKKCFVDLDGVLTDFEKKLAETLGKKLDREWDFGNDPKVWAKIDDAGEEFWVTMEWMPDGHELWDYIKDFKPTVLTSPSRHPTSKSGKKIWLKENLPGVPAIIDSKKEEYAKDGYILIDDREKNIKKWEEAGGIGVLHKDTKSTIKKLKKIMDEKEKESNDLVVLRDLSARLLSLGFEKEAQHLDLVAGKWEDFLQQEKMRKTPGTMLMDQDSPAVSKSVPQRSFFPDRILVNIAIDTLMELKDQKASIIAEGIRELGSMDAKDPMALQKKTDLIQKAQSYRDDVGDLISTLLSLRYDNRDKFKIRDIESEMKRLQRKILETKNLIKEDRPGDVKNPFINQPPVRSVKKDPFEKLAKAITINPYDVVVQEAVQELGNKLQGVDIIQLEMTCPGDRIAWVSNKDLIKGRPGKERIIHLCLKKIKDQFKGRFGKAYSAVSPEDNRKMKEMVKEFLVNVVLPHEYVHIQQELTNQGEFGTSPETEAEKAENWKAMEPFGIRRAMIKKLDRIADSLEAAGFMKEAYSIDAIADSLEASITKDASLELAFENLISSLNKRDYPKSQVLSFLDKVLASAGPVVGNITKLIADAWKNALGKVVRSPGDVLTIVKRLKMKSGELAEKTMPIGIWADMAKMNDSEFINFVDSPIDHKSPPSDNRDPVHVLR